MKNLCVQYGNVAASVLGVVLALALIGPPLLLTESPCNDVVLLTRGEQAACVAPGWAGRARVVLAPAANTSAYLLPARPPVSRTVVHAERVDAAAVPARAHRHVARWLLNASRIAGRVTTSAPAAFCLVDAANYARLRAGAAYASIAAAANTTAFAFAHRFVAADADHALERFFVVARNDGAAPLDANFTTVADLTQYDVASAAHACHGARTCAFPGVAPGMVLLTVVHGNFSADHASVAMGWGYRYSVALPWVVVILAVAAAVAVVAIVAIALTFRDDTTKRPVQPPPSQEPITEPSPQPQEETLPE